MRHTLAKGWLVLVALMLFGRGQGQDARARELSFEQRVAAQQAIEQVYWKHRIWPKENPTTKPPFASVTTDAAIRTHVEDYLRQSNALQTVWRRPITGGQLQAEIERMSRESRDPGMLRELYASLGNDAFVIAETLARQTIAGRLAREWYATDERFHGELKRAVEQALGRSPSVADLPELGGQYVATTFVRRGTRCAEGATELSEDEWNERQSELARRFGAEGHAPVGRVSDLAEDADAFSVKAVLSAGLDAMTVASVVWPKPSFDAWWSEERRQLGDTVVQSSDLFSLTAPAASCVTDTWDLRFYAPSPRTGHTSVWTGTEMIVWGGSDASFTTNTGGRYNPATNTWTQTSMGSNVPAARFVHTAVWTGTEMIVWGGQGNASGSGSYLGSGARYDPNTDTWAPTSLVGAPSGRQGATAVWTGSEMIVWGGYNGSAVNTGGRYKPSGDAWTATSTGANVPSTRSGHTAVWTGSAMIVWGGSSATYERTGGRYDPASDTWTPTSVSSAPTARSNHVAVWTGTQMIVWSGNDVSVAVNTGSRYNPATDSWLPTSTSLAPSPRSSSVVVWTGTEMIVWGGNNLNSGGRYAPASNTWSATPTSGAPIARTGHSGVWTGAELIVFGGYSSDPLNSGGRYSPTANSWVATSTGVNVPAARRQHSGVWTGAELIVWGGVSSSATFVPVNTGGRYDPATDLWTPTSLAAGVPTGRAYNTAVWTGTEMIVWGGHATSGIVNTGARYDPASNAWVPTATASPAPSARRFHTAVWTGTKMIIWGGSDASSYFQTGGVYTPSSNSWTATAVVDAPSARDTHRAVWTGTQMIVWGGYDGNDVPTTGGRYNPGANTWLPTSTVNAPNGRDGFTAVWTETEMIIWGGRTSVVTNTGGRYNPASDTWVATSTGAGVPAARQYHTAVWTGTEMVVWAGRPGPFGFYNTGGRYDPVGDSWKATSVGANVPYGRFDHVGVYNGERMIVWGGDPMDVNLGLYCAPCEAPSSFYRDQDGDGYGDPATSVQDCQAPAGYVTNGTDCNDGNASIHPDAPEACNGIDDDCDTVVDDNAAPALVGAVTASKAAGAASFDWTAIPEAARYDVVRGTLSAWPVGSTPETETCLADDVAGTGATDADAVPENTGYWYLVRAENACGDGSYGSAASHGVPTAPRVSVACAP